MTLPSSPVPNKYVSRKRLVFLCTLTLAVSLLCTFVWASRQGLFALSADDQTFTELYFDSSRSIPARLTGGQQYTVPFSIVNREAATRTYSYQILLIENGRTQTLPGQSLRLAKGQSARREVTFTPAQSNSSLTAIVQLQNPKQQITFRVGPN